jgi:hypothetical protein
LRSNIGSDLQIVLTPVHPPDGAAFPIAGGHRAFPIAGGHRATRAPSTDTSAAAYPTDNLFSAKGVPCYSPAQAEDARDESLGAPTGEAAPSPPLVGAGPSPSSIACARATVLRSPSECGCLALAAALEKERGRGRRPGQPQPVRSAYQPPASSTFLSEGTSHQQPAATSQQYSSLRTNQHQPSAFLRSSLLEVIHFQDLLE